MTEKYSKLVTDPEFIAFCKDHESKDIMDRYDIPYGTLYYLLKTHNIEFKKVSKKINQHKVDYDSEEFREYLKTHSIRKTAMRFSTTPNNIQSAIRHRRRTDHELEYIKVKNNCLNNLSDEEFEALIKNNTNTELCNKFNVTIGCISNHCRKRFGMSLKNYRNKLISMDSENEPIKMDPKYTKREYYNARNLMIAYLSTKFSDSLIGDVFGISRQRVNIITKSVKDIDLINLGSLSISETIQDNGEDMNKKQNFNDGIIRTCHNRCHFMENYNGDCACMLNEFKPIEVKIGDKCVHGFLKGKDVKVQAKE